MSELKQRIIELVREKPQYGRILAKAIEIEKNPPDEFTEKYGWEWHEVQAMPPHLTKLVGEGILEIGYKSRRYTHYKLVNIQETEEALKELGILH